jgi:hypothetical protein
MTGSSQSSTPNVRGSDALALALVIGLTLACSVAPPKREAPTATPVTQPARPMTHPVDGPHAALSAFLDAAGRQDFEACWRLLASPLRERYTPARLAEDFSAVKERAEDKLARVHAAFKDGALRVEGGGAALPLSEHKELRLVHEADGWKIAELE